MYVVILNNTSKMHPISLVINGCRTRKNFIYIYVSIDKLVFKWYTSVEISFCKLQRFVILFYYDINKI